MITKTHSITFEDKDTKILVSEDGFLWKPRYLSRNVINCDGNRTIYAYVQGKDSYTSQEILNQNARDEVCKYAELYSYFYEE